MSNKEINKIKSNLLIWVGILGMLAVVLGAFGAHVLKEKLSITHLSTFKTGVMYHFYHVLALFCVVIYHQLIPSKYVRWAGICFIIGIFLFSGSLYLLSTRDILGITNYKWLGPITPIGGLFFIFGWLLLFFSAIRK
ncbi:MAG: DUF423 domain-containing protein [Saprospiraceae bacterium]